MAYAPTIHTLPADRPRLSRLICFVFGSLTTLAFEPFGLSLLAPIFLLPLLFVCITVSPRDAAGHAFWYGFGLFLTGTYWIYVSVVVFGEAPLWIALLLMLGLAFIMALWLFAAGWMIGRFGQEPLHMLAVAPAAWVLVEWLRGWVLSGFPWLAFGYAHVDSGFAGWAPVAGVYGVSFAVVLSAAAALVALTNRGLTRWVSVGLVFAPWVVGGLLTLVDWTDEDGAPLQATVLQFGISQDQKWKPENRQDTLDYYRDGTRIARSSNVVVWPEVAVPSLLSRESAYVSQLQSDARESGQTILFGILEDADDQGRSGIFNSVVLLDGQQIQSYRKRHLVPFGEYFPVPDKLRQWMKMMSLPHSDLLPGRDVQDLLTTREGMALAVMVCYEDAYGAEQLYAFPDAGVIINVSNDAWFGDSIAAHQHFQIARMRSLEVGRPTIRATNTGISAFIDHRGEIVREGAQFRSVAMTESVQPRRGLTPYASKGNVPIVVFSLLVLGFFWIYTRR